MKLLITIGMKMPKGVVVWVLEKKVITSQSLKVGGLPVRGYADT